MSEPESTHHEAPPTKGIAGWLFYLGAAGLLLAMTVDAVAVVGRHVGWPLLGSIELVQAAILVASSAAMLSATLAGKHATVHMLMDRLSGTPRAVMHKIHALLCALFFLALACGGIWILSDLWHGQEESEVLHIPFMPLRVISIIAVLGVALTFVLRIRGRRAS
jgi:TRAP-type C4-dicarboxylate transport system permease small subunit